MFQIRPRLARLYSPLAKVDMARDSEKRRPERILAKDFAERKFTLPENPEFWRRLLPSGQDDAILLLGPGPGAAERFQSFQKVFWLPSPRAPEEIRASLPASWREVDAAEALRIAKNAAVYFYTPARRLAPGFWGPLVANIKLLRQPDQVQRASTCAWAPGGASLLLHREVVQALAAHGFDNILTDSFSADDLLVRWSGQRPELAVSINFRGLDSNGEIFELLRGLEIPLAIWLVDNPWNLLSGIALPWWREANIFVTDPGFIPGLRKHGARHVFFLPLAAPEHMLAPRFLAGSGPPLFVGRSAFPDKAGYFAGARPDAHLSALSGEMIEGPVLPDFHWWTRKENNLWPGRSARGAILGAENCSSQRRALWLRKAAASGLEIVGDDDWRRLVPGAAAHPPVDYYGALAGMYGRANCVLNVTSLLLPASLNQRHFDVWAAGGFLLSDATPGLEIFPAELTAPISLRSADELGEKCQWFASRPERKRELAEAWRQIILAKHLYKHRLGEMMDALKVKSPAPGI